MKVTLYTRDGHVVAVVTIPPFQTLPEVLCWGSRYFALRDGKYCEACCFMVTYGSESLEPVQNGTPANA